MKKQVDVVMLPTKNNKAPIDFNQIDNKLSFGEKKQFVKYNPQHLYFLSDEEIKEGDIVKIPCGIGRVKELHYKLGNDNPSYIVEDLIILSLRYNQKENEFQTNSFRFEDIKKIIATTDESLYFKDTNKNPKQYMGSYMSMSLGENLSQPSQQFIEKYIEEYNKGNIITDVLIEYELISNEEYFGNTVNPDNDVPYFDEKLKINPKDNTITIKKVKDSYTREEILDDIEQSIIQGLNIGQYRDKWIEENL